eukprot:g7303.t1
MFRRQLRSQLQMPEQHQKPLPKRLTPTEMKHQQKPTPKKEFLETVLEEDYAPATSASNPLVPASATREIEDWVDPDFPKRNRGKGPVVVEVVEHTGSLVSFLFVVMFNIMNQFKKHLETRKLLLEPLPVPPAKHDRL